MAGPLKLLLLRSPLDGAWLGLTARLERIEGAVLDGVPTDERELPREVPLLSELLRGLPLR